MKDPNMLDNAQSDQNPVDSQVTQNAGQAGQDTTNDQDIHDDNQINIPENAQSDQNPVGSQATQNASQASQDMANDQDIQDEDQISIPENDPAALPRGRSNIDFLLDVNLEVSVELGRARMAIKDMLQLGPGSVIELDKLTGEPVDLLVNNNLVARGEVVVFDENFGIRVTDIVNPEDRIRSLR